MKRYRLLAQSLQTRVNVLENQVQELETKNAFLSDKLIDFQLKDSDKQIVTDIQQDKLIEQNDEQNPMDMLRKQIEELESKNRLLCDKLTDYQWDEEIEKQNHLIGLVKRREMALVKVKRQYEADMKNADVEIPAQSDDGCGCDCDCDCDEID